MALPWILFSAASITSKRDESTIHGNRATSGSDAIRLRKWVISSRASIMASSIFISSTIAPSRTCARAIASASSYDFSLISRRNLRLPATLQRSPTFTNVSPAVKASSPASHATSLVEGFLTLCDCTTSAIARIWSGVEPQQPPTIFTNPCSTNCLTLAAMRSGVWS